MIVKELKELLATVPDHMVVMLQVEDLSKPGMFALAEACTCETGVVTLGTPIGEIQAFLILPHGAQLHNEDEKAVIPDLN